MRTEQKIKLLHTAAELFKKHGVKALSMDDVARAMGMSKKTIYALVYDKADLVKQSLELYLEAERVQMESILGSSENSIDELIKLADYFSNQVLDFTSSALVDIHKHYPDAWDIYSDHRYNFMLKSILRNIENGVKQGVYRANLNSEIISKIYIAGVDILGNQRLFPAKEYVFLHIYKEYINYHLRGIVSEKGLRLLEQHNIFKN
ncbi:MAG: TetR/AcrR family transcriptional regulator [Bacteroidetes bacterium]|nr:TetR/AcrR family transcriptional regulator [Bacteroidota bacterium]